SRSTGGARSPVPISGSRTPRRRSREPLALVRRELLDALALGLLRFACDGAHGEQEPESDPSGEQQAGGRRAHRVHDRADLHVIAGEIDHGDRGGAAGAAATAAFALATLSVHAVLRGGAAAAAAEAHAEAEGRAGDGHQDVAVLLDRLAEARVDSDVLGHARDALHHLFRGRGCLHDHLLRARPMRTSAYNASGAATASAAPTG